MSEQRTLLPLRAQETALLIRASRNTGEPVALAYGTGGAALIVEDAPWAVPLLDEWRGHAFADGGGI